MQPQRWPTNGDYVAAVSDLSCFDEADLRAGEIRESTVIGIPECATGQNAIVFPVQVARAKWAVRCFTTPAGDCERRYRGLAQYVTDLYCPPLVEARWVTNGIEVGDQWWPIVKMRWAEGRTLSDTVKALLDQPDELRALAERWREAVRHLRFAKIAHGDLQHGNVVVDGDGAISFVDYDGIWFPGIADLPVRELGHPNYQHPQRTELRYWDEHIDSFSALVIYTSLVALAADPSLWDLHNGENLIFTARDFRHPRDTVAWQRLNAVRDPSLDLCAGLLDRACATTVRVATDLDEILETRRIVGAAYPPEWWDPDSESVIEPGPPTEVSAARWGEWSEAKPDDEDSAVDHAIAGETVTNWRMMLVALFIVIAVVALIVAVALS